MILFDIGDRIRERRRDRGLSQAELAELANLNYVTISKYESGKVEPGAKALARIADALDISVDALLCRDDVVLSASDLPDKFTDEEKIIISNYRTLTEEGKAALMAVLSGLLTEYKK